MTVVYLARHGETAWNVVDRLQGRADVPLNARGAAQAAALASRVRGIAFDAVVASPLARAIASAPRAPVVVPDLAEIDYGAWTGTTREARWCGDRHLAEAWELAPDTVRLPDGESYAGFRRRVLGAWRRLRRDHHTVFISAHGHVNRIILLDLFGWAPARFWDIAQPNASCQTLRA